MSTINFEPFGKLLSTSILKCHLSSEYSKSYALLKFNCAELVIFFSMKEFNQVTLTSLLPPYIIIKSFSF